jgi:carboxypeptidase C (cathepsin A)
LAEADRDILSALPLAHYTLQHLGLDPTLVGNISTGEYGAGHMMCISDASLAKLKRDVSGFLEKALR